MADMCECCDCGYKWMRGQDGPGDRIAQLVIIPYIKGQTVEVESLAESERGAGGFGSTGER